MAIMTLDDRIKKDLDEIYNNKFVPLQEIIAFAKKYNNFNLTEADKLSINLFGNRDVIATRGVPSFFVGKRDAETVMVMLNPGQDVALANNPISTYERINRGNIIGKGINISSLNDFIDTYKEDSKFYGEIDVNRLDNFDLKQAAFLKPWKGWDVIIKDFLDPGYEKLGKDEKNEIHKEAKKNVLKQKLSLELIPYASRKFEGINTDNIKILFPYLETVFDEIFRIERKYVIFCSNFYEELFNQYNNRDERLWDIEGLSCDRKYKNGVLNKSNVYCRPITIKYRHKNRSQKAIIAHTFPNRSLSNAYEKMEKYGEFCYDEWLKY